jgi:hypothetical protein
MLVFRGCYFCMLLNMTLLESCDHLKQYKLVGVPILYYSFYDGELNLENQLITRNSMHPNSGEL